MEQSESLYRPCHPSGQGERRYHDNMIKAFPTHLSVENGRHHAKTSTHPPNEEKFIFFFFLDSLLPPTSSLVILQPQDLNKTKMQFCRESCNLMQRQLY